LRRFAGHSEAIKLMKTGTSWSTLGRLVLRHPAPYPHSDLRRVRWEGIRRAWAAVPDPNHYFSGPDVRAF
jgi:hypothetical protein